MNKKSSTSIASEASKILKDPRSPKIQKQLAGSVLSQAKSNKDTSDEIAAKAAQILESDKYGDKTKSLAGSVLSQSK
jgi:hypothetical protein